MFSLQKNEYLRVKIDVCDCIRHNKYVTSEFKWKFYKYSGSPNLAMITKFDIIVKIGGCTQLSGARTSAGLLMA